MIAPMYPTTTWDCGVCGRTNPGDIGFCPRCRGGAVFHDDGRPGGGLDHGAIPYYPVWHVEQYLENRDRPPYEITDAHLPVPEKYPHHKRGVRP